MSKLTSRRRDQEPTGDGGSRPVYSIGAVGKMLDVDPSTLRSWEDRYGLIVPARTAGSQRVYSRDQVARLRFVLRRVAEGASAADAHRLLAHELGLAPASTFLDAESSVVAVLLAERDRYAADLFDYLLRTEGYDVCLAFDPEKAYELYVDRRPALSIVELMLAGGGLALCERLAHADRAPVLAISALDWGDRALAAGASAFLLKPVDPLEFVSTVRDLLGDSALTRGDRVVVR